MIVPELPKQIREFVAANWGVSRIDTFKAFTAKGAFPIEFQSFHLEANRVMVVHRIVYLSPTGVRLGSTWKVSDFLTGRYILKTSYPTKEIAQLKGVAEAGDKLRAMATVLQWTKYDTPNCRPYRELPGGNN